MSSIRAFENLACWQQARELVLITYRESMQGPLTKDFGARDQLRRAALSVMNNIAEGFGRSSNKEFIRFLDIAQSSCLEVKSMTYVLEDLNYLPLETVHILRIKAEDTKGIIRGLMKYLRNTPEP